MGAKNAKQVVYRYNGDPNSEEVEFDMDGEVRIPEKDEFMDRKAKMWKVVIVNTEVSTSKNGPIPVVRIFLTDQF